MINCYNPDMGCLTVYLILTLVFLLPLIFANLVTGAFIILGFSPQQAILLLFMVLFGGLINIPVKTWPETYIPRYNPRFFAPLRRRLIRPRRKILAVNLGGAVIPGAVSIWQVYRIFTEFSISHPHGISVFLFAFLLNVFVSYKLAKPVENTGITLPAFIPPLTVSIPSLLLAPQIAPVIAFPAGVLGVLIGADIMHLGDIRRLDSPGGSIGGAGTFDGVFLSGILSVFLTG